MLDFGQARPIRYKALSKIGLNFPGKMHFSPLEGERFLSLSNRMRVVSKMITSWPTVNRLV